MSLEVTQRPTLTVLDIVSNWNGVKNPVVYKMQRKDLSFDVVNDDGGDIQLEFTGVNVTSSFALGDIIYIKSDDDVYDLFAEVTAESFSGGDTLITVDAAYVSATTGGYVNNNDLRPLYRVEVEVYDIDDEQIGETHSYSPNTTGALLIDISEIVKGILNADIEADLTASTEVFDDTPAYTGFYIKYTEVWTGSAESQTDDVANQFYTVLGARQIPSAEGGNMLPYVASPVELIDNGTFTGTLDPWTNEVAGGPGTIDWAEVGDKASITLTSFLQNGKWLRQSFNFIEGIEYTLSVDVQSGDPTVNSMVVRLGDGVSTVDIYNAGISSNGVKTFIFTPAQDWTFLEFLIANSDTDPWTTTLDDVEIDYNYTEALFLTRLTRPKVWRGYPFLISSIIGDLGALSVLNITYLDSAGGFISADNSSNIPASEGLYLFDTTKILAIPSNAATVQLRLFSLTGLTAITGVLTCDIVDPCANPIMLIGRNSLGGAICWLFDVNQEYTFDYGDNRKAKRLILTGVNLTINEWESLQDFITLKDVYRENILELTSETNKTSRRIDQQLYVVDSDGNKIGVIAIPTRNRTETKQNKHTFELEIEYPEEF